MKKFLLGALAFAAIAFTSCKNEIVPNVKLSNNVDTISYLFGKNEAQGVLGQLKTIPGDSLNKEVFLKGFIEEFKQMDLSCKMTEDEINEYFKNYFAAVREASLPADVKAKRDSVKRENEEFIAAKRNEEGYQTTPSGLVYKVIKEGNGAKPAVTDVVKVHYVGKFIDGTVFDSSRERGEAAEFPLNGVIPGWTEGLQLMPVGSVYELVIPSDLAYGDNNPRMPPFATLVFEVELLDIVK